MFILLSILYVLVATPLWAAPLVISLLAQEEIRRDPGPPCQSLFDPRFGKSLEQALIALVFMGGCFAATAWYMAYYEATGHGAGRYVALSAAIVGVCVSGLLADYIVRQKFVNKAT